MTDQDRLIACGRLLYGAIWQRSLARGLGPLHPDGPRDSIDDRAVRRWVAGDRPVPAWVWGAMIEIGEGNVKQLRRLLKGSEGIDRRALRVRRRARRGPLDRRQGT